MSAALDVFMVVAARVLTKLLWALATGSDAAHASVWAFEVTGDIISAGEPGGYMSARKITDDGGLLSAANCKLCQQRAWRSCNRAWPNGLTLACEAGSKWQKTWLPCVSGRTHAWREAN